MPLGSGLSSKNISASLLNLILRLFKIHLSIKFSKEAFIFLLLSPLPSGILPALSKLRVNIKQRFGV